MLCKIDELKETRKQFHFGRTFGCCYGQKTEYFVTACKKCPYNAFMFGRYLFASIGYSCFSTSTEMICAFCIHLKEHLNYHVNKVCIEVSDKSNLSFQAIPLKQLLVRYKDWSLFVFGTQHEYFEAMIDHLSYKIFF